MPCALEFSGVQRLPGVIQPRTAALSEDSRSYKWPKASPFGVHSVPFTPPLLRQRPLASRQGEWGVSSEKLGDGTHDLATLRPDLPGRSGFEWEGIASTSSREST